ncbi:MAG: DUF4912 domain-containing protein [Thermoguttaceae bacterium]
MATSADLNLLTAKSLASLAKELGVIGWRHMKKEELVNVIRNKSRGRAAKEIVQQRLDERNSADTIQEIVSEKDKEKGTLKNVIPLKSSLSKQKKEFISPEVTKLRKKTRPEAKPGAKLGAEIKAKVKERKRGKIKGKEGNSPDRRKENPKRREMTSIIGKSADFSSKSVTLPQKRHQRDVSTRGTDGRSEQLVLLVRGSFWLQAFWEVESRSVERAKVAMGPFWHTAVPVLRLFRIESDGLASPKRVFIRDIVVHGGVNHWYLDVADPPAMFQVDLGYLSRERNFHPLLSSNSVETPSRQVVDDDIEQLDGNWRGVADDLDRVYKWSGGSSQSELRRVFEEQLGRSMSAPLLSQYRASQQGISHIKSKRNFLFDVNADLLIHGKTDPNVQVTIRNEPIDVAEDGTFCVRFSLPEKRHIFPMEAEGSDNVEMQRVVLTVERNTRVLETLIQEHTEED